MRATTNQYCSRCLRTRRFHEIGDDTLMCEHCRKRLYKTAK